MFMCLKISYLELSADELSADSIDDGIIALRLGNSVFRGWIVQLRRSLHRWLRSKAAKDSC